MKSGFGLLAVALVFLAGCTKEKDTLPKDIFPNQISNLLSFSMFKITKTGSGNYEYGCVFKPRVNGKVTALRCLMPEIDNYRVTLWDSSTKTVLASVTITGDDTIYGNTVNIAPQAVKSGQPYLLSIRSIGKKWYEFRNHAGGQLSYPLSSNYIQVTGYLWKSTVAIGDPVFPTNISTTYISGLADFSFQPD